MRRENLKLYKRYIDDIIIIWRGTENGLKSFLEEINHNIYGITFTGVWDKQSIDYLDLQIFKAGRELHTRTFFKKTDRNGYIPTNSCHHPKWVGNVPKGQLMLIRRNCSTLKDYDYQANILIERFLEKGYKKKNLESLKNQIRAMDRNNMIEQKKNEKNNRYNEMAFLTGFSRQHKLVEKVLKKHWPVLRSDNILRNLLPNKPSFIYRRAPALRNRLVHNALDPPKQIKISKDLNGFFKCGKCLPCRKSKKTERKKVAFRSLTTGKEYKIKELITCTSTHVTYVLECPCHKQYVGRTTRPLFVRIREHINNIKTGFTKHGVSRHFKECHNEDPSGLIFYGIDKIKGHWRGDNKRIKISQNETRWIFTLDTLQPKGLNIDIDLNCFLTNF